MKAATLLALLDAGGDEPLARLERGCFRARFPVWRDELAELVRRRIVAAPRTPVASDQEPIGVLDRLITDLDLAERAGVDTVAAEVVA